MLSIEFHKRKVLILCDTIVENINTSKIYFIQYGTPFLGYDTHTDCLSI